MTWEYTVDLFCFCVACALSIISMRETKGLIYPLHNPIIILAPSLVSLVAHYIDSPTISEPVCPPVLRKHELATVSWPRLTPERGL
jgi:hypothetical protein